MEQLRRLHLTKLGATFLKLFMRPARGVVMIFSGPRQSINRKTPSFSKSCLLFFREPHWVPIKKQRRRIPIKLNVLLCFFTTSYYPISSIIVNNHTDVLGILAHVLADLEEKEKILKKIYKIDCIFLFIFIKLVPLNP